MVVGVWQVSSLQRMFSIHLTPNKIRHILSPVAVLIFLFFSSNDEYSPFYRDTETGAQPCCQVCASSGQLWLITARVLPAICGQCHWLSTAYNDIISIPNVLWITGSNHFAWKLTCNCQELFAWSYHSTLLHVCMILYLHGKGTETWPSSSNRAMLWMLKMISIQK